MKSGKALVVLFVSIQKMVRNAVINVHISFGQRKESLQRPSIAIWLLIDNLGGKLPLVLLSTFLLYMAGFTATH